MAADRVRQRPFTAAWAGNCVLTGKRYEVGAEIYRHGTGYARYIAPLPPGWHFPEGSTELARIGEKKPSEA